jgi:uncharacterized protein involved in exopolysaccharide biosynthesis
MARRDPATDTERARLVPVTEAEEPRPVPVVGPLEAVVRHPLLFILPVLVLLAGATAIALTRQPEYKAQARLNVGRANVPPYTVQGVVFGNQSLAVSYSRAIASPTVVQSAARRADVSFSEANNALSATAVPGSTVIRIDAEGSSRRQAIALANGASVGLRFYVVTLNRNPQTTQILREYRRAQRQLDRAEARAGRVEDPNSRAGQDAANDLQVARLRASSLEGQYRFTLGNEAPTNLVQVLAPATSAKSDFVSKLQQLLLIGGAAGLILGVAFALLRANRVLRRFRT